MPYLVACQPQEGISTAAVKGQQARGVAGSSSLRVFVPSPRRRMSSEHILVYTRTRQSWNRKDRRQSIPGGAMQAGRSDSRKSGADPTKRRWVANIKSETDNRSDMYLYMQRCKTKRESPDHEASGLFLLPSVPSTTCSTSSAVRLLALVLRRMFISWRRPD